MVNIKETDSGKVVVCLLSLERLTDEERVRVFSEFCTACGSKNPKCNCMREE